MAASRKNPTAPDDPDGPGGLEDPPYPWALAAGAAVFLLYALTLAPTTAFWDTSEYIATAWGMGIPHPPGNPLFVVLARAWLVLLEPTGLSVAIRVNLFSAAMSALAHGLLFLVLHHVLRSFSEDRAFRLIGAAASVLVSATAFTVWNQSNVNEKVYTVSLLTIALLSWLIIRWHERLGRGGDHRLLVLAAFILALSVGNHLMAFLVAPALGLFVLLVQPRVLLRWRLYPVLAMAGLLGLSIHLFLPLRAELNPTINQGAPECPDLGGALLSVVTWGRGGCEALGASLTREQYRIPGEPGPGLTGPRQAPIASQYLNYVQYFDWQWARSVSGEDPLLPPQRLPFTMLFTGLGVWGAMAHHRRDRPSFWYLACLFGTLSVGLVWYMNFGTGYSIGAGDGPGGGEVRERDYFFVASFSVWGLWVGLGLSAIWKALADRTGSLLQAAPVMALAIVPLVMNLSWADRSWDRSARDWAYNLLMSVEPYAVLFTVGDNDTFPLWYLQEVEGVRRDVQVVVSGYLGADWYAKQVRDLTRPCPAGVAPLDDPSRIVCQRPYEPLPEVRYGTGPPEFAGQVVVDTGGPVRPPGRGTLRLDDATIDRAVRTVVPLEEDVSVDLGPFEATLRGGSWLSARDRFTLQILVDSMGSRPVYFSSPGATVEALGLFGRLIREGLAYRLSEEDPATMPDVERMPPDWPLVMATGPYVDSARTGLLLDRVFVHHSERAFWPDHTVEIPNYYAWAYLAAAQAALQRGDEASLRRYRGEAERWSRLAPAARAGRGGGGNPGIPGSAPPSTR